jgi:nuclear pore complex protein Nup50
MGKKRRQAADDEEEWGAGSRALAAQGGGVVDKSKREDKCRAHLRALNKQFASWVNDQSSRRGVKSWAAGCQDYLKHIGQITTDFNDVLESSDDAALPTSTPTLGGFGGVPSGTPMRANPLFGVASAPTPPKAAEPAAPAPSLFSGFGAAVVASVAVTEKPSLFPNAATNPFGAGAPAPGLFGAPGAAAFGGFGGVGGGAAIAATSEGGDAEAEEEARPPSPSFKEKERGDEDDETCLLKAKAKFFTKKEVADAWGDRGVNNLEFLKAKRAVGGLFKCRVLIRNTIGKAVMNAGVYAGLKVTPTTKKLPDGSTKQNGVILNLFNAEEDNEKTMTLIRLPDAEKLQGLLETNAAAMG